MRTLVGPVFRLSIDFCVYAQSSAGRGRSGWLPNAGNT